MRVFMSVWPSLNPFGIPADRGERLLSGAP